MERCLEVNRANWDERAAAHASSRDYALAEFIEDPAFLSHVVRFDQPPLGEIRDLRGVHLQCHIGTDTISPARLGARMTGLDLSPASLAQVRRLAAQLDANIDFVEAQVYDAVSALGREAFDFVFTGIGALSITTSHTAGITASVSSSRHYLTPASRSRASSSTTASRGKRCRARCIRTTAVNGV